MGGYQVRLRPAADRFIVSVRSFVELEDQLFVLPRRYPSWAVPDAASCHLVQGLCRLYCFMCSGHHLCISCVFLSSHNRPPTPRCLHRRDFWWRMDLQMKR